MKCRRVGRVGEEKEERNHTNIKCLLLSDPSSLVVACGYKVRHPYCGIERVNLLCSLVQGQGYNPEESFPNILLINIFNPAWLTLCNCSGCYWMTNKGPAMTNHPFDMEEEQRSRCDIDLSRTGEPWDYGVTQRLCPAYPQGLSHCPGMGTQLTGCVLSWVWHLLATSPPMAGLSARGCFAQDHFQVFFSASAANELIRVLLILGLPHFSKSLTTKSLFLQAPPLAFGMVFSAGEFLLPC